MKSSSMCGWMKKAACSTTQSWRARACWRAIICGGVWKTCCFSRNLLPRQSSAGRCPRRCGCAWVRAASTCEADLGRRLGQHFLARTSILRRISEAACPPVSDHARSIIEIGPGKGALTHELLALANRADDKVIAVEIDPVLVHYLQQKFAEHISTGKLTLIEGDILKTDVGSLAARPVIAGNLPYYITSPILEKIFS